MVKEIYAGLLLDQSRPEKFSLLLNHLRQTEQLAVIEAVFRDSQKKHFLGELPGMVGQPTSPSEVIKGVAALCSEVIGDRPFLKIQVMDWLSKSQGGSIQTLGLRRALLATYNDPGKSGCHSTAGNIKLTIVIRCT